MLVAKYKFDKSIYENLIPVFNDGYEGYTITDEIDSENENYIIRTIECDTLPTYMRFGVATSNVPTNRELSLLEVLELNTTELTSCSRMFIACQNVTSINTEGWILEKVTDMYYMFLNCTNLTTLNVSNWDTSNVIDMGDMFNNCANLTSLDVSNWDTSEVTNMSKMFYNCNNLTLLDVSNFDTKNVTNMGSMFYKCNNLTLLDVSNFNTSNVTNMYGMFQYCQNIASLDVSGFDTSNVTNMSSMFAQCWSQYFTTLDVSNFDTSNVTNMNYMFSYCYNLTTLDVSNFDTSNVTDMSNIFYNTSSLQYIRCNNTSTINTLASLLPSRTSSTQGKIITTSSTNVDTTTLSSLNWSVDTSSGTKIAEYKYDKSVWNYLVPEFNEGYSGYFCNDRIEDEVNSPNVVTREIVGYGGLPTLMRFGAKWVNAETDNKMYYRNRSLLEVLFANTNNINNMSSMFRSNANLCKINFSNFDTSKVTNMSAMFENCQKLTSLDVSNFDTSNVTNMSSMFRICTKLTSLDVSNFDTSNVKDMYSMFNNCQSLTSLDLSNFDTSKATNMQSMFQGCKLLTSLDLSNFDTSNVTTMRDIFNGCNNLTSLDVSNFNTSNVANMSGMFYGCNNLTTLDLSNFNTSKVTYIGYMFAYCNKLIQLNVSNFNTSNVIDMAYMFYGCNNLTTLDLSNWDTSKVTDFTNTFSNTPLLTDIGMIYCSQDTINKVTPLITNGSKTIWVKDTKASDYTATDYVTIKDYKEDNKTLYLNSPLLEGDEIVNKDGKLYHYHKMGKEVLDGSKVLFTVVGENYQPTNTNFINFHYLNNNIKKRGEVYSNNFKYVFFGVSSDADTNCIWTHGSNNSIILCIDKSKLQTTDENGLKQWLQANPTTIVYELTEPYYELISDDPLIVQSYAEGKLDTSSIITPTSIQSIPYEEELTYLYTSTQYCIQFNSTANCTVDITLGGTKVENKSVSVGLNKIYITTPSTLVDNKLIINSKGNATISEVVVVNSNAEFDYFDGLKSSFEDYLVTDVDNENYGKYEVGVKIVGKNKFKGYNEFIRIRKGQYYLLSSDITEGATRAYITMYDKDFNNITTYNYTKLDSVSTSNGRYRLYLNHWRYITGADSEQLETRIRFSDNVRYIKIGWGWESKSSEVQYNNVILEECEQTTSNPTSYEPYKETNATIYLNSPLLKGDRIEIVDGKLCHYHKMSKVMLNGSESWTVHDATSEKTIRFVLLDYLPNTAESKIAVIMSTIVQTPSFFNNDVEGGTITNPSGHIYIRINKTKLPSQDVEGFKQWLSENPTTVVYELAEPYYEDITPIQSSFVISTVSEGDMEIITDLPIKSNITYLTNITSAVLMEQQLDELDNSTESLTNIVEDEINE